MSEYFLTDDFLLQGKTARRLYHDHVKDLPIIDYHCHLSPADIATNRQFANLTDIWLRGDHYKWRAQRSLGVPERLITGDASDEEKFHAWAGVVPQTIRNPLFHWTHMELKNVFGITEYLNAASAASVYGTCNELLKQPALTTQGILSSFKVEYVGTTDEPWDTLEHHQSLAAGNFPIRIAPSFRPDRLLMIGNTQSFIENLELLEKASAIRVTDIHSLLEALQNRVDFFHNNGCRVSDHGLVQMPASFHFSSQLESEFSQLLQNRQGAYSDPDAFMGYVLLQLCKMYHAKNWVQQFHLGPIRNNNTRLNRLLGADSGFDSIGDFPQALQMSRFFDRLDQADQLARTVIYNINPSDNEVFATMLGNFNDGSIKGKMQFGSGWWFLDQKDGMEKQLNALSNMGLISTFIGMITDSRSFLSFPRHEYFRRILCNLLGDEMEKGILPNDEAWIGGIVRNISYYNAKEYFNL
ncbi:MAG: glucuronate isomerase [Chitinophagaceae bacterium]|nr:glucuronate isomerase [Chitinophagaceae bacterium]MEA3426345.1 glucuronate isomerase [Bacteroidota bacterium]MCA6453371.1 glucuronate isomerase [Chitinophagaceae bacterium]MCA6456372.1 glucuronate isomerase [Chitinophagaceae bacterium]MCA6457760.1 glucuronate isomerase [Chitinophagaceae bacterium]